MAACDDVGKANQKQGPHKKINGWKFVPGRLVAGSLRAGYITMVVRGLKIISHEIILYNEATIQRAPALRGFWDLKKNSGTQNSH